MSLHDFFFLRVEKERNTVAQELEESTHILQGDQAEKTSLEKNGKLINASINDAQIRLEELQRALHEADGAKRKLMVENCDLTHHLDEGERLAAQLSKDKTSLTTQLEDAKRLADAETRVSATYILNSFVDMKFASKYHFKTLTRMILAYTREIESP